MPTTTEDPSYDCFGIYNLRSIVKKHEIETESQSILIVEDDEITRNMLTKSLETNDFKVIIAKNGKEALERLEKAINKFES